MNITAIIKHDLMSLRFYFSVRLSVRVSVCSRSVRHSFHHTHTLANPYLGSIYVLHNSGKLDASNIFLIGGFIKEIIN